MLVLTRKYQEKIRIGNNITITVLRMKGKAVRLGIEAPVEVPVVRGELAFNGESETAEVAETVELERETGDEEVARSGRTFGRMTELSTLWPANSRPDAADVSVAREPAPTVGFSRVSRNKVGNLLPKLVAGPAPLKAMMGQNPRG